jgi:hypothetical protein
MSFRRRPMMTPRLHSFFHFIHLIHYFLDFSCTLSIRGLVNNMIHAISDDIFSISHHTRVSHRIRIRWHCVCGVKHVVRRVLEFERHSTVLDVMSHYRIIVASLTVLGIQSTRYLKSRHIIQWYEFTFSSLRSPS